jgi:hypothetical protein
VAAKARSEVMLGVQIYMDSPDKKYGLMLNPKDRKSTFVPKPGDRLVVLAEDDG